MRFTQLYPQSISNCFNQVFFIEFVIIIFVNIILLYEIIIIYVYLIQKRKKIVVFIIEI